MAHTTKTIRTADLITKLERLGAAAPKLDNYSVLCLPENLLSSDTAGILDGGETLTLAKLLKAVPSISCAHSFDLGLDIGFVDRRSDHKWLGAIWIRDTLAIPFVVAVLSSMLANTILRKDPPPPQARTVHAEVYVETGEEVRHIQYDGDADAFVKLVEELGHDQKP